MSSVRKQQSFDKNASIGKHKVRNQHGGSYGINEGSKFKAKAGRQPYSRESAAKDSIGSGVLPNSGASIRVSQRNLNQLNALNKLPSVGSSPGNAALFKA